VTEVIERPGYWSAAHDWREMEGWILALEIKAFFYQTRLPLSLYFHIEAFLA
jgi:hypothetical protein